MKWMAALGVAGYAFMIVHFGWLGLVAAALHIGILMACVKR